MESSSALLLSIRFGDDKRSAASSCMCGATVLSRLVQKYDSTNSNLNFNLVIDLHAAVVLGSCLWSEMSLIIANLCIK
jgi:hypothetical protein